MTVAVNQPRGGDDSGLAEILGAVRLATDIYKVSLAKDQQDFLQNKQNELAQRQAEEQERATQGVLTKGDELSIFKSGRFIPAKEGDRDSVMLGVRQEGGAPVFGVPTKVREAEIAAGLKREQMAMQQAERKEKQLREEEAKKKGKTITAGTAKEIGEYDSAVNMADRLQNLYTEKASGFGSSLTQFIPSSQANQYEKDRAVAAQTIGGILEGGKLTEEDYNRYYKMLPDPADTNEIAQVKINAIKQLISARKRGAVEALGQAGFDISQIPTDGGGARRPTMMTSQGQEVDRDAIMKELERRGLRPKQGTTAGQ